MSISIVMISLLVTFGLATTSAQAEERLSFKATFGGTFVKTQFDTNGDGAPANLNILTFPLCCFDQISCLFPKRTT